MKKRGIAAIIICALSCGMLAGCQGGEEGMVQNKTGQTASGQTQIDDNLADLTKTVPQAVYDYAEVPEYVGVQNFSEGLFRKSLEETNPVLSPVSAYLALSLAGEGAKGETAQEFQNAMGENRQAVSEEMMDRFPTDTEKMKLMIANSAWVDDQLTPDEEWLTIAGNAYRAQVFQMGLATPQTMQKINAWIKDETQGLITDFLEEPLDEKTRMALFNTVYFKGKWENPFDALDTRDGEFTLDNGETVITEMMNMKDKELSYVQSGVCDGILLPYQDSDLVYVALKPVEGMTVREMYDALDMEQIGAMVDEAQTLHVNLMLPKYEVSFDRTMNNDLNNMGLKKAFDSEGADFSGLGVTDSKENLYISLVRQKAVFIVDEEGTEAAAVTEVAMAEYAMYLEPEAVDVYFDEPFLYMILDPETDVPLFMGIMDDPTACGGKK